MVDRVEVTEVDGGEEEEGDKLYFQALTLVVFNDPDERFFIIF